MTNYKSIKSQKIASAIYLITDTIKDSDFLKWEIREESIRFVSNVLSLGSSSLSEQDYILKNINSSVSKILSLLDISSTALIISRMNVDIVTKELNALLDLINNTVKNDIDLSGYILSDSYFATDVPNKSIVNKESSTAKNVDKTVVYENKNTKKDRQDSIIGLLRTQSGLTIKDFVKVIKDCSEKTIQRELTNLVEKGLVKKSGERRWSTYSLVESQ